MCEIKHKNGKNKDTNCDMRVNNIVKTFILFGLHFLENIFQPPNKIIHQQNKQCVSLIWGTSREKGIYAQKQRPWWFVCCRAWWQIKNCISQTHICSHQQKCLLCWGCFNVGKKQKRQKRKSPYSLQLSPSVCS